MDNDRASLSGSVTASGAAWREGVRACTGRSDGFVYGGEAGKVLTFVRRGRASGDSESAVGVDIEDGDINGDVGGGFVDRPALPEVIRWVQDLKRDRGVLSFVVTELEARRDRGVNSGWECFFVANFGAIVLFVCLLFCRLKRLDFSRLFSFL